MRRSQRLFIMVKPVSWNELLRKHYFVVRAAFLGLKKAADDAILEHRIKPFLRPVVISVIVCWKGARRHDVDNVCLKPILDQLVEKKILADDSMEYILAIRISGMRHTEKEGIDIVIGEIEEAESYGAVLEELGKKHFLR